MDVFLFGVRVFLVPVFLLSLSFFACGDRFNLNTERGRQSRIDDANFHLSRGECTAAAEAIDPLYNSAYVTDEVRVVKSSTYACVAGFNLLRFLGNIAGASNYFQALVKSMTNTAGDGAYGSMYAAIDVLTLGTSALNASSRSKSVNTYMVFLQLGTISTILRNYGSPDCCNGTQGAALVYDGNGASPAGEMADTDACALAAALSHLSDSFSNSDLSDASTSAVISAIDGMCASVGVGTSCSAINRNRVTCDGSNAQSQEAELVVNGVNAAW